MQRRAEKKRNSLIAGLKNKIRASRTIKPFNTHNNTHNKHNNTHNNHNNSPNNHNNKLPNRNVGCCPELCLLHHNVSSSSLRPGLLLPLHASAYQAPDGGRFPDKPAQVLGVAFQQPELQRSEPIERHTKSTQRRLGYSLEEFHRGVQLSIVRAVPQERVKMGWTG